MYFPGRHPYRLDRDLGDMLGVVAALVLAVCFALLLGAVYAIRFLARLVTGRLP